MIIEQNKAVSFSYQLYDENGQFIEDGGKEEPVTFLCGHHNIIRGLEAAMLGHKTGDEFSVTVEPSQGYGSYQANRQQRVPIKHLMNKGRLRSGMIVSIQTEQGVRQGTVIKVGKFNVDVDTNHPLAGKTLRFDVEVLEVREAGSEEIAHGHAHGSGGHHH